VAKRRIKQVQQVVIQQFQQLLVVRRIKQLVIIRIRQIKLVVIRIKLAIIRIKLAIIRRIKQEVIRIRLIRPLIKVSVQLIFQLPNIRLFPKLFLMERIPYTYHRQLFPKLSLMGHIQRMCPRILKEDIRFNIRLRNNL
jgi:hypothetical protein